MNNRSTYRIKTLTAVFFSLLLIATAYAQTPQSKHHKAPGFCNATHEKINILERQVSPETENVSLKRSQLLKVPKSKARHNLNRTQIIQHKKSIQVSTENTAIPELLIGDFQCSGISYFGGLIRGTTTITPHETESNRVWIENLIPGASNQKVYAIVGSNQNTITIPQNQVIFKEGNEEARLAIHNSASDITGMFVSNSGKLLITTNLWGARADDGWYDIFSGQTTYTRFDMLPPEASYKQPQGGLFLGLIPDTWDGYLSSCLIASAYTTWKWNINSHSENISYSWTYTEGEAEKKHSSNKDSLLMDVDDNFYTCPILTASDENNRSSTFKLGANYQNSEYESYIIAGGNATWLGFDENCDYSAANMDNGFTYLSAGNNSYYFGTGASGFSEQNYESLLVYYDEPQSTLFFTGVNVYLFIFEAPDNTEFHLEIFVPEKDEEGFTIKGETLAKSTIKAQDVTPIEYNNETIGYTMQFNGFEFEDEDGFIVSLEHIELDSDFYLELSGFNANGVRMAVASEEFGPDNGENRSFFTVEGDESIYYWESHTQTMYFNLSDALHAYVSFSDKVIYDDRSGGTYTFYAYPYFDDISITEQDIPDWINVEILDEEYSENNWRATIEITIAPLAENEDARYYDLLFSSTAATNSILINQGGPVSVNDLDVNNRIFAYKNNQGYVIRYPENIHTLTVYTLSGALIQKHSLPENGTMQLNKSSLPKGMYLLNLNGKNTSESLKIRID